jgi:hypothetical protein
MADTEAIAVAERGRLAALDRLLPSDLSEYERYCRSGKPDLSPETNKRLFELYLNGMSIQDMLSLNPGLNLGLLLKARVDGRWDERRDAYLGELLGGVTGRVKQMAAEALGFMTLQLGVMHKKHGMAMKKFMQTGDPKDLQGSGLVPDSIRDQKTIIEAISRLLEAGKPAKGGEGGPLVAVTAAPGSSVTLTASEGTSRHVFTAEEADAIRSHLEKK